MLATTLADLKISVAPNKLAPADQPISHREYIKVYANDFPNIEISRPEIIIELFGRGNGNPLLAQPSAGN
ncbi:MAG: hypothetical protein R3A44_39835 [Caldilineaceae bacterium]